jgi:hypothetical protein
MLHALSHIPPQPPGIPLPHSTENGFHHDERIMHVPDGTPATSVTAPIKPVDAAKEIKGRKRKGKSTPRVKRESNEDEEDDLTPPPVEIGATATPSEPSTGRRRGKRISYAEDPVEGEEPAVSESTAPKRTKSRKAIKDEESEAEPSELSELSEHEEKPITTPKKRAKKTKATPKTNGDGEENGEETPAKVRKPTPKKSRLAVKDEPEFDEDGNEVIKKKRKPKVYPKIEYDIPDVEKKTTTFKGTSNHT